MHARSREALHVLRMLFGCGVGVYFIVLRAQLLWEPIRIVFVFNSLREHGEVSWARCADGRLQGVLFVAGAKLPSKIEYWWASHVDLVLAGASCRPI